MKLTFLGATETVTGSKYLIEVENKKILLDCGLFQGEKELRLRNWRRLPVKPAAIDAVVLTHAHIDHSGYLPLLVKHGFTGSIYATKPTYDLCSILLPDSGHIQEEDAKRANKYHYSKHHPALPLYTQTDAEVSLFQFKLVGFGKTYSLFDNIQVTWHRAGHILGAAFVEFEVNGTKLLFSGDMGRMQDPIMRPPTTIQAADYLVLESTYGDRLHEKSDPKETLSKVINQTVNRGGTILIPAFAVGRTQHILYYLAELLEQRRIPDLPIYLDSPMAINATDLFCKHAHEHKLSQKRSYEVCGIATYINTPDESKEIDRITAPKIIISASGMMTGGRILHHLKVFAPDKRNTILMTGFQAAGTRGARLLAGETELKIHGQMVPVRAQIEYMTNTSAHADYGDILTWLRKFNHPPQKAFITHGEPAAAEHLKMKIISELGWQCDIPQYLDEVSL